MLGAAIYFLVVRKLLIKNGSYVNRLPQKLDLEELLYRPLLTRWLPTLFGWIAALFGENRLTTLFSKGALRFGAWLASLFGENRITAVLSRQGLSFAGWLGKLFGENRLTARLCRGLESQSAKRTEEVCNAPDGLLRLLAGTVYREIHGADAPTVRTAQNEKRKRK